MTDNEFQELVQRAKDAVDCGTAGAAQDVLIEMMLHLGEARSTMKRALRKIEAGEEQDVGLELREGLS